MKSTGIGDNSDHGGDLDRAMAQFGGCDWIDLSTGINRKPWPVGAIPDAAWRDLPDRNGQVALCDAAATRYGCRREQVLAVAGASAAIQLVPGLQIRATDFGAGSGEERVRQDVAALLWPSYNEHGAALAQAGWSLRACASTAEMVGADLAVVVNPNNPDGRCFAPQTLRALAGKVGLLVVDESFADPRPDLTLAADISDNVLIMRSFGKFWGLAGLRLGFVLAAPELLANLARRAGPWAVSGPALAIGTAALRDTTWADEAVTRLAESGLHADRLARRAGWRLVGGTHLFRLYDTDNAAAAQAQLARHRIWSRIFPYSQRWLRLGLPGTRGEWERLSAALA